MPTERLASLSLTINRSTTTGAVASTRIAASGRFAMFGPATRIVTRRPGATLILRRPPGYEEKLPWIRWMSTTAVAAVGFVTASEVSRSPATRLRANTHARAASEVPIEVVTPERDASGGTRPSVWATI